MASHWLGCPPNGYLGSRYGAPVKDMLQTPLQSGAADDLITKFQSDVPLAKRAPSGAINVYAYAEGNDTQNVVFEVMGNLIPIK